MSSKSENVGNDPTNMGSEKPRREPEGKEGAGAHQGGLGSKQTGQSDRMSKSGRLESGDLRKDDEPNGNRGEGDKTSRSSSGEQGMSNRPNDESDNETANGGQKTGQGKKQSGPDDNRQGGQQQHAGQESRDQGDQRRQQGGSGGGQGNRQTKDTNKAGSNPSGNKPRTN